MAHVQEPTPAHYDQPFSQRFTKMGFSLVEVLVVTALIMTIAGMTMPALGSSLAAAKRVACQSNMRQVAVIVMTYAGDYHDRLPAERNMGAPNSEVSPAWFERLPEYIDQVDVSRGRSVFQCPSYTYRPSGKFKNALPKSYKWNARIDDNFGNIHYRLGAWSNESRVLLFADAIAKESGMGQWGHLIPTGIDRSRHRGHVTYLALDGHSVTSARLSSAAACDGKVIWAGIP